MLAVDLRAGCRSFIRVSPEQMLKYLNTGKSTSQLLDFFHYKN